MSGFCISYNKCSQNGSSIPVAYTIWGIIFEERFKQKVSVIDLYIEREFIAYAIIDSES